MGRGGRAARQRSAKPRTPVRTRSAPPFTFSLPCLQKVHSQGLGVDLPHLVVTFFDVILVGRLVAPNKNSHRLMRPPLIVIQVPRHRPQVAMAKGVLQRNDRLIPRFSTLDVKRPVERLGRGSLLRLGQIGPRCLGGFGRCRGRTREGEERTLSSFPRPLQHGGHLGERRPS